MTKVELFEIIRKEHYLHGKSVRELSRDHQIHRRTVRQALENAMPPSRKPPERDPPVLTLGLRAVVDRWLKEDRKVHRKQRHTGRRVFQRLTREEGYGGAESTVRRYVGRRRRELGVTGEAYCPQHRLAGDEAEMDWYEADVDFPWGRERVQFFEMRACFSGREFHRAYPRQTQQALMEGHVKSFEHFGGVFKTVRYDNLSTAVRKVLRGRRRLETDRFVALRSHYLYGAEFCRPGKVGAPEKGGVEGGVGRFRRGHLVPVPKMQDYDELNAYLLACCAEDDARLMMGRTRTVEQMWLDEAAALRPLPTEHFDSSEGTTVRVDSKGRVSVRTNRYSVPISLAGRKVEARVQANRVDIFHGGRRVAGHPRLHGRHEERLKLDHYLELLQRKPGALKRSTALHQAREAGQWPQSYDRLWTELQRRYGQSDGTRHLLDVLMLHRQYRVGDVHAAVELSLEYGCCDGGAVAVVLRQLLVDERRSEPLEGIGLLERFERPADTDMSIYDTLLIDVAADEVVG